MPDNFKVHIARMRALADRMSTKAHKLHFEVNQGKTSAEEIALIDSLRKLQDLAQDLEHLNLGIDIAQQEIKKGTLDKEIIEGRLKPQLARDLIAIEKKLKSALRSEKQAEQTYESIKLEKSKDPEKKEAAPAKEKKVSEVKKAEPKKSLEKISANDESKSKNINSKKEDAIKSINGRIDEMGHSANKILLNSIEKNFDIKGGNIVGGKDFVKQLNKLTVEVLDLLQSEPKFTGPVGQFVKRFTPISEAITDFQKSVNGIKVPPFEAAKNIVIDETLDKMLNNGLNQKFVQPLRDLIYQNVMGGLSLANARTQIKEFISGGNDVSGKLGSYVEQTAQQAVDAYSGIINTKLLETFEYDGLLITGSLIDNSSAQCRYVIEELGGKITRENWQQVEKIAKKHGLIEGTTFDNLPLNKLHWNCRHSFFPVIIKKAA